MGNILQAALKYRQMGFSVIPIQQKNKKPCISWEKYQREKASPELINKWWDWYPNANVAIVTGEISGINVVDVDSQAAMDHINEILTDSLITPTSRTPRDGWHYYFQAKNGLHGAVGFIKKCDLRAEGNYIIAPPSIGGNRKPYAWLPDLSITEVAPAPLPDAIYNILIKNTALGGVIGGDERGLKHPPLQIVTSVTNRYISFEEGNRDNALFHIANCLVRGGMPTEEIEELLRLIASELCNPPFPLKEIPAKIQSALKRAQTRERNLSQEILAWVSVTERYFTVTDCDKELQIVTKEEKANRRVIFHRLVKEGILERHKDKEGVFRRVQTDIEPMDFLNVETETVDLTLPFNIDDLVKIMPGNIMLIAGEVDAGKTAFLLNVIAANMHKFEIHYFNSEMGGGELRNRLLNFDDIPLKDWRFKAWERSDNFADVVVPGKGTVNIIDFLEIYENFYEIGGRIAEIHKKLNGAIAIIAIQKNPNTDIGLGGYRSLEKPRLALAMSKGSLKIVKAKNWKTHKNPNEKEIRFKIVKGCKLIQGDD